MNNTGCLPFRSLTQPTVGYNSVAEIETANAELQALPNTERLVAGTERGDTELHTKGAALSNITTCRRVA
jgi:hypothetical protein